MRKLIVVVVFTLCAIATYQWFKPDESLDASQSDKELLPDYIALNIKRTQYNADGFKSDEVTAARLEHFDTLGFTQFENPVYTLFNNDQQASWKGSSQFATWFPKDKVILEQNVVIQSLLTDNLVERIETDTLEMLFPDNQLQNSHPVHIQGKGFYIKGVGLKADLKEKALKLTQHIQTEFNNAE